MKTALNDPYPKMSMPIRHFENPIEKIYRHTLLVLFPFICLTIIISPPEPEIANWYNCWGPIFLTGVLVVAGYRIARALPAALWSPAVWMVISSAVFFGFGPLVEVFGNHETKWRLSTYFISVTELELFGANRLSFISIFLMVFGFWIHMRFRKKLWVRTLSFHSINKNVVFKPKTLAIAFVLGGMIILHGVIRPSHWGILDITIPGALTSIGTISDVGFAIAFFLAIRGSMAMRLFLVVTWPVHLFLTLLAFSKTIIMIALIFPAIGAYLGHKSIFKLLTAALTIGVIYSLSQNFVTYGRLYIRAETGTIWDAGYAKRVIAVGEYFSENRNNFIYIDPTDTKQHWWVRLNYSGVQAAGVQFRKDGVFIDSTSNIWTFFIPRMIWRDKPIYKGPGGQFYTLLTGNKGVNVGNSVMGDVYWQFGWGGILIIMPMIGVLFAMFSWRSIEVIQNRDFVRIPLVLLAILMAATGLTKWLSNGIISVVPIYFIYLLLINFMVKVLHSTKSFTSIK